MAYIDRTQDPRRRNTAIAAVAIIHAAIGYALVTGLGGTIIDTIQKRTQVIDFTTPPDELPPPPEPSAEAPPESAPILAPTPPIDIPLPRVIDPAPFNPEIDLPTMVDRQPQIDAQPRPAPSPSPLPSIAPTGAVPKNDPGGWVQTDDYPSRALREGLEGTTGFRLVIGSNGRVNACEVTAPSGHAMLDEATCKFVTRRARFEPATDGNGAKVVGSYSSRVTWQLPR